MVTANVGKGERETRCFGRASKQGLRALFLRVLDEARFIFNAAVDLATRHQATSSNVSMKISQDS